MIAAASLLALATAWVSPPEERRVVLAPLEVEGDLSAHLRATLRDRLREGLDRDAFVVVDDAGADTATVRTKVIARGRDLDLAVELVEVGAVIARVEEQCDMCGEAEAGDTMVSLGTALSRRAALAAHAAAPPPPRIEPIVAPVLPTVPRLERRPVRWAIGWSALATGIAASVGGATLLAIDGTPIRRKCTGSNVDRDGTCRFAHATTVPGAVITSLGVGLLATGIALVVIEKRRTPKRPALRAWLERTPAWSRALALSVER